MKEVIKVNGGSARYLSELKEFKDGIPFGVVNKVKTDVGGTYCAINCDHNYIVVVPYRDLCDSVEQDKNNKYKVFKKYSGINKSAFNSYIADNDVKKFVVTYDSLPILIDWIGDITSYKLLIDEYHLILEEMDYREDAISNLTNNITAFKHYSFLSATPINFNYEIELLSNIPYYEVEWNDYMKVKTISAYSKNIYESLISIINQFNCGLEAQDIYGNLTKVEELYIYMNSVQGIKQVCDTLELDPLEVKICCAERRRNKLTIGNYEIESVSSPNKRINFFTKKCFQGCNLFSNNGLVIICSDARKEHTLIDVATTMEQIVGRLRFNDEYQNCFRDVVLHLFSTSKDVLSQEEFDNLMAFKEKEAVLLFEQNNLSEEARRAAFSKMNLDSDIVSVVNNRLEYNQLKKQSFIYKYELKKSYSTGLSIRNKIEQSKKLILSESRDYSVFDIMLKKATIIGFKQLYADYIENYSNDDIRTEFNLEYPEFATIKRYMTDKECNSLKWNKEKIMKAVNDKQQLDQVYYNIFKAVTAVKDYITPKDLKALLAEEFKKKGITLTPKASMIENNKLFEVKKSKRKIDNKSKEVYIFGQLLVAIS